MAMAPETVIFVDVDGVLNIGVKDKSGESPLVLNESNRGHADTLAAGKDGASIEVAARLLSVYHRSTGGTGSTYSDYMAAGSSDLSSSLVRHLAQIIQMAPQPCQVVLSSSWRKPHHGGRVLRLEAMLSKHLGRKFSFDAGTRQCSEHTAADRLACIGDYVETLCSKFGNRYSTQSPLLVLLLEDFFVQPFNGWLLEDAGRMNCVGDGEKYLEQRAGARGLVRAKIVHTYDEWETAKGLRIQVGAGLTDVFFAQAEAFLAGTSERPRTLSETSVPEVLPLRARVAEAPMEDVGPVSPPTSQTPTLLPQGPIKGKVKRPMSLSFLKNMMMPSKSVVRQESVTMAL
mmetsp:Transcript_9503/g.33666  ORF Transcript_9503/g.33666 Transcript_9503/m.33666 type:complete len:344 (-) Transcript_9503:214-1245(-)